MIWPQAFEDRLVAWRELRDHAALVNLEQALGMINDWWWRAPMVSRSIHTAQLDQWPGPWDLVAQSGYCDLARALGMLYTVMMLQRADIQQLDLIQTTDHNLVQIDQGKYILNWSPGTVVNIPSSEQDVRRQISSQAFERQIG